MIKGFFAGCEPTVATPQGEVVFKGQIVASIAPLYITPNAQSMQISQLVFGEHYREFSSDIELTDGWHLVQSLRDDYTGYVYSPETVEVQFIGNAKVSKLSTALYSAPSMKSKLMRILPFGAELNIERVSVSDPLSHHEFFYVHYLEAWVYKDHVQFNDQYFEDPIELARQFIGQTYLWGGRSGWGCDCSALVQLCYELAGCRLPRDANLQQKYLPAFEPESILRDQISANDLLYWPGHVAIASSSSDLIHATRVGMHVVEEPIDTVCQRIFDETRADLSIIHRPILAASSQAVSRH